MQIVGQIRRPEPFGLAGATGQLAQVKEKKSAGDISYNFVCIACMHTIMFIKKSRAQQEPVGGVPMCRSDGW